MAINKKLIHFNEFDDFNSKKLSANIDNTQYRVGVEGEVVEGSPDILYQSIVYIKDTKQIWTHDTLYLQDQFIRLKLKYNNYGTSKAQLDAWTNQDLYNGLKIYEDLTNEVSLYGNNCVAILYNKKPTTVIIDVYDKNEYIDTLLGSCNSKGIHQYELKPKETSYYSFEPYFINVWFGDGYLRSLNQSGSPTYYKNCLHIGIGNLEGKSPWTKNNEFGKPVFSNATPTIENVDEDTIYFSTNTIYKGLTEYKTLPPINSNYREFLTHTKEGLITWSTINLEDICAYGVQWNKYISDPQLTRIGNNALHQSLPIQSKFKACIAQGNKVMYYLDPDDWNYKLDPEYFIIVDRPSDNTLQFSTNDVAKINVGDKFEWNDIVTVVSKSGNVVTVDWGEYPPEEGETLVGKSIYMLSRLDGFDGTVRIETPGFYIKGTQDQTTCKVLVSEAYIDNSWTYQPPLLIDAFKSTILNEVPENMGYLSTLSAGSAISVVNNSDYCRGGNNDSSYDSYNEYKTMLGKPRTNVSLSTAREAARKASSEVLSYEQYKNVFYWLFVIEYANFNSQTVLGNGITNTEYWYWQWFNKQNPIAPCGQMVETGTKSGTYSFEVDFPTIESGETTIKTTLQNIKWRGFEEVWGDIDTMLEGYLAHRNVAGEFAKIYTTSNPQNYGDASKMDYILEDTLTNEGYVSEYLFNNNKPELIPGNVAGTSTTGMCDYYSNYPNWVGTRQLSVGGTAIEHSKAGIGCLNSGYAYGTNPSWAGFRTVSVIS